MAPELFGVGETADDHVLDGSFVLLLRDTRGTVDKVEATLARVDLAGSVFAVDILDTRDKGTVDTLTFGSTSTT